jgi:hypothetical protein
MATPGQNPQNQQSAADLQKDIDAMSSQSGKLQSQFAGIVDSVREIKTLIKDTSTVTKLYLENATDIKNIYSETRSLVAKLGTEYIDQEQVTKRINENESLSKTIASQKRLEMREYVKAVNAANAANGVTNGTIKSQKDIIKDVAKIIETGTELERSLIPVRELRIYLLEQEGKSLKGNQKILDGINSRLEAGNKNVKDMQVKATALSKIFGSMSGIPFLKDFMDFKELSVEFQKGFGAGMTNLGKQLRAIITNPLFLAAAGIVALVAGFKALIKLAFDFDKIVTDIGNNTGITRATTVDLLDTFRAISSEGTKLVGTLDSAFLSVKNQANAMLELQETLGTNVMFTNERIQNEILLTKQLKMSKEEAAGIQKLSLISGQSAEKILNTAMKQNTTAVSYKKIFAEISKINSEISTAYKNNPELIAKAVVEANKLGMSLEQTKNISKSLLDFETSIAGELESELLLGKRFNFEKARALALDGKSVEAASELMGQIGGINALTQMNVIQRERLAASIGMSAEELTKSAQEQAVLNALGVENKNALEERYEILRKNGDLAGIEKLKAEAAKKEGGELLLQDIARANLQDRFNESMEQLKQIFTELATTLIPMLEGFAKMLSNTTTMKIVMASLVGMAAAIATSMVIATGGTALVGAAIAGLAVGGLAYGGMSTTGGKGESELTAAPQPSLPTRNNNLPTNNNNNQGNNAAGNQRSDEQRRLDISLNIDGKAVSTVMKSSDYSYS